MIKRKIAVFTGNRAEYGLQYPILKAISAHPALDYFLLVSGSHLQEDFGYTVKEIEKDGFRVHAEVKLIFGDDNLFGTAQAIGSGILSLSRHLAELRPDFLVVYADRFEGFSAVITGSQMNIPTVHVEGGDLTEGGALDDSVRHAMTKLAHLHFTTNEEAAERIRKLGEEPWRVFNVGFPVIDLIREGYYASRDQIEKNYGIDGSKPIVLFTQHSVTTEFDKACEQVKPALEALELLAKEGCQIVITYPNNDAGGKRIIAEIEKFKSRNLNNIQCHKSLGRFTYHGLLNLCGREGLGVCVGNSSSGIKETPAFGVPCVNIGSRQNGRLRSTNVLDVPYERDAIEQAVRRAIHDRAFRDHCARCSNPYGEGRAGKKIADILSTTEIDSRLLQKKITY